MTLSDLISKLEGVTEGSRELDARIAVAADFASPERSKPNPLPAIVPRSWRQMDAEYGIEYLVECLNDDRSVWSTWIPRYTTSVDAAITLVPDGVRYSLYRRSGGLCVVVIGGTAQSASAPTLPLAIVLASLKSRSV